MEESTPDDTPANADTLRRELKKVLTEILHDGGISDRGETDASFGVLERIDEAVRLLTCLRKVESKKLESNISPSFPPPSVSVQVPKEFKCILSNDIMIEPVVIASGQTYEKRYITQWLKHEGTCPKSKEVLSHRFWAPNHLVNELITQWCRLNKFARPKPSEEIVVKMFTDQIGSLLQRITSSSSVADQTEAAKELHLQTKKFTNVRGFFVDQIPDSITKLLSPLAILNDAVDLYPELQEHIVATLFNLSAFEKNKTVIAENPQVIPLLTKSMKQGTDETRRNSAGTLLSLSVIDSNKIIIGNSEALKGLIDLIKEGDFLTSKEAASAVFLLCRVPENKEKAILAGLVPVITNKIKEVSNVDMSVALLALISTHKMATEAMENLGIINDLFSILRKPSSSVTSENAAVIVFNMLERNRSEPKLVAEEEKQHKTFTKLASQGTERAVRKAEAILRWIKKTRGL